MARQPESVQQLAANVLKYFKQNKRKDGESFWTMKGEPDWVREAVYQSHEGMMPDDWKFQFVVDALDWIQDHDDDDVDSPSLEADIYTADLLSWLSSNLERTGFVDEAVEEYGWPDSKSRGVGGIVGAIMMGQIREREQVYWSILGSLRAHLEEQAD